MKEPIEIDVGKLSVRFKFINGAGIVIRRDNPTYLISIGRWFCNEVDALPIPQARGEDRVTLCESWQDCNFTNCCDCGPDCPHYKPDRSL